MNILVLGHNGMLGHMLVKYLTDQNHIIHTINSKFPSKKFKNDVLKFNGEYIINAIGSIPQKTNIFDINYELPIWLDRYSSAKIIHPSTDCEIDQTLYGTSKKIASEYIKSFSNHTKIIKTSIIGPELNSKFSLFEWFLHSDKDVKGYTQTMWNGITTLQWSIICNDMINNWDKYDIETIVYSDCISKFELLKNINLVFQKNINILEDPNHISNKCMYGIIKTKSIADQLLELKSYYYND